MLHRAIATLRPHLGLSKDRAETLALIKACPGLDPGSPWSARAPSISAISPPSAPAPPWSPRPIAAALSGLWGSWPLALDRTQWRIGTHEVNFLVLAAVTRRFRAPLIWTVIRGRGNSGARQRVALMRRYLKLFDLSTIRLSFAAKRLQSGEWIVIATNRAPRLALAA